ncbi:MAG: transposase [Endomicrobium sp.]|jgi:hypothetical protein|nr:transposase [Endomicrobium sp.]
MKSLIFSEVYSIISSVSINAVGGINLEISQGSNQVKTAASPAETHDESGGLTTLPGHIRFKKQPNGNIVAIYSKRCVVINGKTYHETEHLGRVIDKENGIFLHRDKGFIKFSLEDGYDTNYTPNYHQPRECNASLNFGPWMIDEIIKQESLDIILNSLTNNIADRDTLYTLISFYIFGKDLSNKKLDTWYWRNYTSVIYPNANVYSQAISDFLKRIGNQEVYDKFFNAYLTHFYKLNNDKSNQISCPILIDSTGLINSIDISLTATSNHNGVVNDEIRLIYIVDSKTNMPVLFRYIPGNVIDNNTLKPTIKLLQSYGITIERIIVDAGYYCKDNILELATLNIPFITRMSQNGKIYKDLIENNSVDIETPENIIQYGKRFLYIKKTKIEVDEHILYAYIALDNTKELIDRNAYLKDNFKKREEDKDFISKMLLKEKYFGKFILITNTDIDKKNILDLYYQREQIEQIFDVAKNMTNIIPLRVHSVETLRGHLLLSFISVIIYMIINNKALTNKLNTSDIILQLSLTHIHLLSDGNHIIYETNKQQRLAIEALGLQYPFLVKSGESRKVDALLKKPGKGKRGRPRGSKNKNKIPSLNNSSCDNGNLTDCNIVNNCSNTTDNSVLISKRRGRPKGSKNNVSKTNAIPTSIPLELKRKSGRPKGSLNRPKNLDNISINCDTIIKRKPGRPKGSLNK